MKKINLSIFLFLELLITSTLYAQQWDSMPKLFIGTDTVTSVWEIDNFGSNLYFSTDKGLFKSSDNGNSWSNLTWTNGVAANQKITHVFVDTSNNNIYVSSDSSIYKSTDNGATWNTTIVNGNLKNINHIYKTGNNMIIAHGVSQSGGVMYSTDGLVSIQTGNIVNLSMNHFLVDGNTIFVAGKDGVYKSTDNAQNWILSGTGHPAGGNYGKIIKEGSRLFAADIWGKGLYKSDDNGNTWGRADSSTFHSFCQVFDIVEHNGTILTTMDGPCNASDPIKSSVNNGDNWSPFMTNLPNGFYSHLGVNPNSGCFFTFLNFTLKQPFRYCISTGLDDFNKNIKTVEAYPNPVTHTLTIKNDIPITFVSVSNMLGQIMVSETPLTNTASINFETFQGGIYFVTISSNNQTRTLKVVKK